jgi:hypothetical protein
MGIIVRRPWYDNDDVLKDISLAQTVLNLKAFSWLVVLDIEFRISNFEWSFWDLVIILFQKTSNSRGQDKEQTKINDK